MYIYYSRSLTGLTTLQIGTESRPWAKSRAAFLLLSASLHHVYLYLYLSIHRHIGYGRTGSTSPPAGAELHPWAEIRATFPLLSASSHDFKSIDLYRSICIYIYIYIYIYTHIYIYTIDVPAPVRLLPQQQLDHILWQESARHFFYPRVCTTSIHLSI